MIYPDYTPVLPRDFNMNLPVAFAIPTNEPKLLVYLNTWLKLNQSNGTIDSVYQYWILGEDPQSKKRCWSIMQDVLGWTE